MPSYRQIMSSGIEIKVYGGGKGRSVKEVPQWNRSDKEVEMLRTWIIPSGDRTKKFHWAEQSSKATQKREKKNNLLRFLLNSVKKRENP